MTYILRLAVFLLLNFGALALGAKFTSTGATSEWYNNLEKAPWTPPGWVFGIVWSMIMLFLSIFMTKVSYLNKNIGLIFTLYFVQLFLNIVWNPSFFYFHKTGLSLLIIIALTIIVSLMITVEINSQNQHYVWLVPYFIWLIIATSLNYYSWAYN
jgi:tryptophan-rich sensory protein